MRAAWFLIFVALLSGCTHKQLTRNTALTATTVSSIQYQMVVDNLAAISCDPGTMPSHVRLANGTVQISNHAGWGESGGFTALGGVSFGIDRWGPNAQSRVSEQWGTDAVENPIQVWELGVLYRRVLGLPLPPTPNFIQDAIETQARKSAEGRAPSDNGNDEEPQLEEVPTGSRMDDRDELALRNRRLAPLPVVEAIAGPESNAGSEELPHARQRQRSIGARNAQGNADKPLTVEEYELPIGWFGIGGKHDVPKNARYVGRCKERYVWVMPEGMEGLSQFTLAVLTVTKIDPGERSNGPGLMYIP